MKHDDMTHLLDAILCLQTREELECFFDDLCTIQEINAMVQRFDVALQLDKGLTYSQIAGVTHASTATISRVNRSLVYGAVPSLLSSSWTMLRRMQRRSVRRLFRLP